MAETGYSGTPLPKKLGLKPGQHAVFIGLPDNLAHLKSFEGLASVSTSLQQNAPGKSDVIHIFETQREALEDIVDILRSGIQPHGMIWISWPKKASKVPTSITEDVLREIFLPSGLVDVKVCAVDEIWSGLKFVIRKELRK